MMKGALIPAMAALKPPSAGPMRAPAWLTPTMLAIWRPRSPVTVVSATTVSRLIIHIC